MSRTHEPMPSDAMIGCTCHKSFRVGDATLHHGLLKCPRCELLHTRPTVRTESPARQRARQRRRAEAAQKRLF